MRGGGRGGVLIGSLCRDNLMWFFKELHIDVQFKEENKTFLLGRDVVVPRTVPGGTNYHSRDKSLISSLQFTQ